MEYISNSELSRRRNRLRHIFFPNIYGLVSEAVIAVLALIIFNATWLSNRFVSQDFDIRDPLSSWGHILSQTLDLVTKYGPVQQALLFLLWAVVGALIYIMIFRLIQVVMGFEHSLGLGVRYLRQDRERGLLRWFASLHDFFASCLIHAAGAAAVALGALVCFGIASQELNNGLAGSFPANVWQVAISFLAAILSARIIVLGLTLLSARFRDWYTL